MSRPVAAILARLYLAAVFVFVFAPIAASVVFSFTSDRVPTMPLGGFTFHWYRTAFSDPEVWTAFGTSLFVAAAAASLATLIGFATAYTDFRYGFPFKATYLALALLPPAVPLVVLGLAMLAWLSSIGLSGTSGAVIISHTVLGAPFAMAVTRLRLARMDPALEAAGWNLGASEWAAMRHVILPFCGPAIISAFCLTAAVSFDEFAIAGFVSGSGKTVPVVLLDLLRGDAGPRINAIGTVVLLTSMTLVALAQMLVMTRGEKAR